MLTEGSLLGVTAVVTAAVVVVAAVVVAVVVAVVAAGVCDAVVVAVVVVAAVVSSPSLRLRQDEAVSKTEARIANNKRKRSERFIGLPP